VAAKSSNDYSEMSPDRRIRLVEEVFVIYPQFERIVNRFTHCHQHSKISAEPSCLLVTGRAGCGKTTLAKFYEQKFPKIETEERTVVPILFATIFAPATVKGIATGLLYRLGDPLADRGTIMSQTLRLYRLIKECGVELIILDEFQHLIDRDSDRVLQVASDWLKNLLNNTQVPMILIGMPSSVRILETNDQLRRRFSTQVILDPFGWKTTEQCDDLRKFLYQVESALPFAERSHISSVENTFRIFCASGGVVSNIMKIIRRAAALAIERGTEKLTLDVLGEAYDEEIATIELKPVNPFLLSSDKLEAMLMEAPATWNNGRNRRLKGRERRTRISETLSAR
jgi:Cdc6-like AAA superfamily ATPase